MKKLLIVAGAGASLEFGMPSVAKIDSLFKQWSVEDFPLALDPQQSLYSWTWGKLDEYVRQRNGRDDFDIVNFERLLHLLQQLSALDNDITHEYYRHALNPFIRLDQFPEVVSFRNTNRPATGDDFHFLQSILVDKLLKEFRERCRVLPEVQVDNILLLKSFFLRLQEDFDIGIVNLNYDNVILNALPDLRTGFNKDTGAFDRAQLYDGTWNFCYHMHGSVHFDMRLGGDGELHKVYWNNDLDGVFQQNSSGRSSQSTTEGLSHLTTNIIAGLDKTNQLLSEPFGPYFMLTDQLIHESDAILFMGYGFADNHLNRKFSFIRADRNKCRKVVVIDWAHDDTSGLAWRQDTWSYHLFGTLPTNGHEMGKNGWGDMNIAGDFKKEKAFERSSNPRLPLSVWYNGMLEACRNADKIVEELL